MRLLPDQRNRVTRTSGAYIYSTESSGLRSPDERTQRQIECVGCVRVSALRVVVDCGSVEARNRRWAVDRAADPVPRAAGLLNGVGSSPPGGPNPCRCPPTRCRAGRRAGREPDRPPPHPALAGCRAAANRAGSVVLGAPRQPPPPPADPPGSLRAAAQRRGSCRSAGSSRRIQPLTESATVASTASHPSCPAKAAMPAGGTSRSAMVRLSVVWTGTHATARHRATAGSVAHSAT
jgi:hypothetical protein